VREAAIAARAGRRHWIALERGLINVAGDVRYRVDSGKHLLAASISPFDPERTSQGLDLFRKMLSISRGAGGMGHERSEQQVDRRANLRLFLAAFVQSASKLNTDFQSGSPNEATIEPRATIFGEKQGEVVR
jgi:hypothetical protein